MHYNTISKNSVHYNVIRQAPPAVPAAPAAPAAVSPPPPPFSGGSSAVLNDIC